MEERLKTAIGVIAQSEMAEQIDHRTLDLNLPALLASMGQNAMFQRNRSLSQSRRTSFNMNGEARGVNITKPSPSDTVATKGSHSTQATAAALVIAGTIDRKTGDFDPLFAVSRNPAGRP